ncbi:MFS transporter [Actinotalea sp. Marseille-Q4924]|uniref:MFS transporter n=1 Tax=Actinotalea sp. Marseille-Q4924 TaxID=2866571 RepID=UPI001CE4B4E9|nr:MFS transporter [Actinotalea sp. Marseille-Q4924]
MTTTQIPGATGTAMTGAGLGPRFAHLLGATGLSNLSDGILQVGIPLLALTLTSSPLDLSLVAAAAGLPWLLLSLHVGVLVDRHDRSRLLALATSARVLVLLTATVGAATGALSLPLLVALVLAFGVAEVVADSSATAMIPSVVAADRLNAANSRLMGVQQVANAFLGGPAAGLLVALGAGWLFGVPAALCAATLLLVLRGLHGRVDHPVRPAAGDDVPPARPSARAEIGEGLRFLLGHRVVRPLLLGATVLNFASAGYFAVFPLWVVGPGSAVGLPAAMYGLLTAALAVGAVAGAVLSGRLGRRLAEMPVVRVCWTAQAALLVVPVLVPHVAVLVATAVLIGFTNMVGNVVTRSMRQRMIPRHLLGRVGGAGTLLGYGSIPLGALLGGVVGETLGLPVVLLGAAAISLAAVARVAVAVPQRLVTEADEAAAVA